MSDALAAWWFWRQLDEAQQMQIGLLFLILMAVLCATAGVGRIIEWMDKQRKIKGLRKRN